MESDSIPASPPPPAPQPAPPTPTVALDLRATPTFTSDNPWDDTPPNGAAPPRRTWRAELPRWLASLNPGRTQREYEKAVTYFFATPGVPQELEVLSFDLLLAYRGALALRAAPPERNIPRPKAFSSAASASPSPSTYPNLLTTQPSPALAADALPAPHAPQRDHFTDDTPSDAPSGAPSPAHTSPLSPATVNIRLTALRQFLAHCSALDVLPQLSGERIRLALRRLKTERRRPYQILDESEWGEFLQAASAPTATSDADPQPASPWGITRAQRAQRDRQQTTPPRSRAGLTGARTAQRDQALLALALATGLRAIELSLLDLGDITRERHNSRDEWWLTLPDAKTKGQRGGRALPLAPALVATIFAYVRATGRRWERAADRATPLFLTGSTTASTTAQRRLSTGRIQSIVDRVETQWRAQRESDSDATLAGEARVISPHALRHSAAVALLTGNPEHGRPPASVEDVRGWLGHFDIRTTQRYLEHLDTQRRRAFTLTPTLPTLGPTATTPPSTDAPPQK